MGLLVVAVPQGHGSAAAEGRCEGPLAPWLECWASNVDKSGEPHVVRLNQELSLVEGEQRDILKEGVEERRHQLVVEVPEKGRTGDGGTALLILAGGRMVHPRAKIDRIPQWAVEKLEEAGVCVPRQLCNDLTEDDNQTPPLDGKYLIERGFVADLSHHIDAVTPLDPVTTSPESSKPNDKDDKDDRDDKGDGGSQGDEGQTVADDAEADGDSTSWAVLWMGLLLVLLLLAFAVVIRRSRGPVAVGHRAASGRLAAVHPGSGPRRRDRRDPQPVDGRAPAARGGDESTTRLRVAPTARHGRQVTARPAHTRTAVVRTELHPQGYVELDRVLYRAVWAEAGRPPPAPGGHVDVAEAPERDCDVLYAFPPTAARHAKGTTR